jgi:hypothetical protein
MTATKKETTDVPAASGDNGETKTPKTFNESIGIDIGTANIVVAHNKGREISTTIQSNAFFTIPSSKTTKEILSGRSVLFFEKNEKLYILGNSAEYFANIFRGNTRRPMKDGILNPKEHESTEVIKTIIDHIVRKPTEEGEKIWFSVPGEPVGKPNTVTYHKSIIEMHLENLGYTPVPINEGMAVIISELSSNGSESTGIGISIGAGMCNVCLSYLSIPVITYSIQKGGDYIDSLVGSSVGEPFTTIKGVKEKELNLAIKPRNRVETALHIYYDDLFSTLAQSLQQILGSSDNVPSLPKPVPIVLSGGTVLPKGCRDRFAKAFEGVRLPINISDIRIAERPLYSTAKGTLMMAMREKG